MGLKNISDVANSFRFYDRERLSTPHFIVIWFSTPKKVTMKYGCVELTISYVIYKAIPVLLLLLLVVVSAELAVRLECL